MRAPRFRFPDKVRTTTRGIAARMIDDGMVAETPEQLDTWISKAPEVRESLVKGGYGSAFTADDLFPLLDSIVAQARGSASSDESRPASSKRAWVIGFLVVLAIVLLLLALSIDALGLPPPGLIRG
jgi:hypothetical protein